ncbi:MAG TPA: hypothetical protein VIQ30_08820 [Pseudonocardia sp.]
MAVSQPVEQQAYAVTDPLLREVVTKELRRIQDGITALTAELHAAMRSISPCDGDLDGQPCILGWHQGHHRTVDGVEWLDAE